MSRIVTSMIRGSFGMAHFAANTFTGSIIRVLDLRVSIREDTIESLCGNYKDAGLSFEPCLVLLHRGR
jgi:NAD/NADP transhydrogenase alpha subunit